MSEIHIACAADGSYVPHSAAMLHSALAHRDRNPIHVHYLHGSDFPAETAEPLAEMVESEGGKVSFHEISSERVADLPTLDYITASTWFRIYLPELLSDLDRVLYLDVDTVVLDSLDPLWETDLRGHLLAAVTNVPELDQVDHSARLGLSGPGAYFNAGVLLLNLEMMRREDSTAALREYTLSHLADLTLSDQDGLNVVLGGRRLPLHPRWNCMNAVLYFPWSREVFGVEEVEEARRNPAIRHFEGPADNKPWHYLCQWGMRELYWYHRQQTPWPSLELEGVTVPNRLRRLLRPWRQRERRTVRVGAPRPR
jgi:lipopolysaccharide biosynthesis glycosyltransferase